MKIFFGTDYAVICCLQTDTGVKRRWTRRVKKIFRRFYYIMKPEVSMFQKQRGSQDNTSSLNMLLNHEDNFFHCRLRNRSNTDYHLSWFQFIKKTYIKISISSIHKDSQPSLAISLAWTGEHQDTSGKERSPSWGARHSRNTRVLFEMNR